MAHKLIRHYGHGHLHFITFTCYRRLPLLRSIRAKNAFVQILGETRDRYGFSFVGYVVMPEHIHLLMSEPARGTPSTVIQVLKQRVSAGGPAIELEFGVARPSNFEGRAGGTHYPVLTVLGRPCY
jgi:REP element-mobilizing transposase RayT